MFWKQSGRNGCKKLVEECDPSQPSCFISEAIRVASSIDRAGMLARETFEVYRVNHLLCLSFRKLSVNALGQRHDAPRTFFGEMMYLVDSDAHSPVLFRC